MNQEGYIDFKHNLIRFIGKYDKRRERPISRLDLVDFDLKIFQMVWDISDPNDIMKNADQVRNEDQTVVLQKFINNPIQFDFSKYAYFLESYTYQYKPNSITKVWKEAMEELSIQGSLEINLKHPFGVNIIIPIVFLKHFGGTEGTVILPSGIDDWVTDNCHEKGYYISIVSTEDYSNYNELKIIEFLVSLGWYGPKNDLPEFIT
jgi:hypothetical protein